MSSTPKMLYLIPDTNVFMQCRHLRELPWSSEFAEWDAITIALVSPVIREIDRQKGGKGRLAKRARAASSLVGSLIASPEVRPSEEDRKRVVEGTGMEVRVGQGGRRIM